MSAYPVKSARQNGVWLRASTNQRNVRLSAPNVAYRRITAQGDKHMRKMIFISTAALALTMANASAQPDSREHENRSSQSGGYQRGPGPAPAPQPNVNAGGQRVGGPGGVQGNAVRSGHGGPFAGGSNTPFDIFGAGGRGFHDSTHYGHHDNNGYDALRGVLNASQRFHYGDYRRPQGLMVRPSPGPQEISCLRCSSVRNIGSIIMRISAWIIRHLVPFGFAMAMMRC